MADYVWSLDEIAENGEVRPYALFGYVHRTETVRMRPAGAAHNVRDAGATQLPTRSPMPLQAWSTARQKLRRSSARPSVPDLCRRTKGRLRHYLHFQEDGMPLDIRKHLQTALSRLKTERERLERQISAVESALTVTSNQNGGRPRIAREVRRGKRGRKAMSVAERRAVSRRMKAYWAKRKSGVRRRKVKAA